MNSKRSYLETLNAGRQRRTHSTLEQLNRSLETLEQRIDRNREERTDYCTRHWPRIETGPPRSPISTKRPSQANTSRRAAWQSRYDQPYQAIARDIERVRGQEDSVAAVGKIASELKGLREELRHQMTSGVRREFDGLRKDIERAYAAGTGKVKGRARPRIRAAVGRDPVACRKRATTRASTCCGSNSSRCAGARHRWRARRRCARSTAAGTNSTAASTNSRPRSTPVSASGTPIRRWRRSLSASNRSATRSTTFPNRCRCVRSKKRCARSPARIDHLHAQQDSTAGRKPST